MDPLLGSALIIAIACGIWLVLSWRRSVGARRVRQRSEDALKHLFEQESRGRGATLTSLAGALRLPPPAAVELASRMQIEQLVRADGQEFRLTEDGRQRALQVIRAHRLLERYFADEARLPLRDVHGAAERGEHALTPADVDRLSAALGHPTRDPHGDPIPTREGHVAAPSGVSVTSWPKGPLGRIVHLEDEPEISFAQIVAQGLHVGQLVRVIESTPQRLVLGDDEREYRLAPAVAANIFLAPAPASPAVSQVVRLSDLTDNDFAEVVGLDEACQGFSRRRLMDLGFTDGARIRPFLRTFAGDPRAYEVRGTLIALRRDQASQVLVRPLVSAVQPGTSEARQ